jgi:hypothetical protein
LTELTKFSKFRIYRRAYARFTASLHGVDARNTLSTQTVHRVEVGRLQNQQM